MENKQTQIAPQKSEQPEKNLSSIPIAPLSPALPATTTRNQHGNCDPWQAEQKTTKEICPEKDFNEFEQDYYELPLGSNVKYCQKLKDDLLSSESEKSEANTNQNKTPSINNVLYESFISEEATDSENKCCHGELINQLKVKNGEYMSQINFLIKQKSELRQELNKQINRRDENEDYWEDEGDGLTFSKKIIKAIKQIHQGINRIKKPGFIEVVSFNPEEQVIPETIRDLKYLMRYIDFGDKAQQDELKVTAQFHQLYQGTINNMKKKYQDKIVKMKVDFKQFVEKAGQSQKNKFLFDSDVGSPVYSRQTPAELWGNSPFKSKKKLSMITETEIRAIEQLQHLKDDNEKLNLDLKEQRRKKKLFQTSLKNLSQKYSQQVLEFSRQKKMLLKTISRYEHEFNSFMEKAVTNQSLTNQVSKNFFTNVSKRLFQISNCIPFQENDEQNFFSAENEEELFDMIERIRRFALKLEEYRNRKDLHEHNLKKNVKSLFKQLVKVDGLEVGGVLEIIKGHQQWDLEYLKDYLLGLRQKQMHTKRQLSLSSPPLAKSRLKRTLTVEQMCSVTFDGDELII